jgi:adenylate cyclase
VSTTNEVEAAIKKILSATWQTRDGTVVPDNNDVVLTNGAVKLDAAVLYADLADSTKLARTFSNQLAAKVVRAFLASMTTLIRSTGGAVRSFDGDRVMGVYVGDGKNSAAARCALQMNFVVTQILRPAAEAKFPSLKQKGYVIRHCVGVASSPVLVVRAGIRDNNDLVFVGPAPNLAAKLSDLRESPYATFITWPVYNNLNSASKLADGQDMWQKVKRQLGDETWDCYRSSWRWEP